MRVLTSGCRVVGSASERPRKHDPLTPRHQHPSIFRPISHTQHVNMLSTFRSNLTNMQHQYFGGSKSIFAPSLSGGSCKQQRDRAARHPALASCKLHKRRTKDLRSERLMPLTQPEPQPTTNYRDTRIIIIKPGRVSALEGACVMRLASERGDADGDDLRSLAGPVISSL